MFLPDFEKEVANSFENEEKGDFLLKVTCYSLCGFCAFSVFIFLLARFFI